MPLTWTLLHAAALAATAFSAAAQGPPATGGAAAAADYIIIGGGTAGCVLASKLCQGLPDSKIVLLERAGPRSPEAELTVRAMRNFFNPVVGETPEVTEAWDSEPNPGLDGKIATVYTGTTLGGSSAVNGAQFSTPTNEVAAGWNVTGLNATAAGALYQRVRTRLGVDQPPPALTTSYHPEYFAANEAVGVKVIEKPEIPDGADVDSVWTSYLAADEIGNRMDSYRGYLEPVREECTNLEVIEGATVTKLLLDADMKMTTGIQYQLGQDGAPQEISVNKEVILSAGPYHSPKLLQLSGIGPAAMLQNFSIPVVADLPVGQSAQSRAYDNILTQYPGRELSAGGSYDEEALRANETAKFEAGEVSALGFTKAQINGIWASPIGIWRVMSFIFDVGGDNDPRVLQSGCIPNPKSLASVSLRSTSAFDTPVVDTNIFGAEGEVEQMIQCLSKEREVIAAMPADFNMTELERFSETITPEDVKNTAVNGNHFVGTCGIGRVLDADLKVLGFQNLRVVDASAIPEMPPNSGPAASVYLLAEHISDAIIDNADSSPASGAEPSEAPASTSVPAAPASGQDSNSTSPAGADSPDESVGSANPSVIERLDPSSAGWMHASSLALLLAAVVALF